MPELGLFAHLGPVLPFAFVQKNSYLKSSMTILTAHFDGKVLVPDSPVKLPMNRPLKVSVSPLATNGTDFIGVSYGRRVREV